jgi:hypothetical protein
VRNAFGFQINDPHPITAILIQGRPDLAAPSRATLLWLRYRRGRNPSPPIRVSDSSLDTACLTYLRTVPRWGERSVPRRSDPPFWADNENSRHSSTASTAGSRPDSPRGRPDLCAIGPCGPTHRKPGRSEASHSRGLSWCQPTRVRAGSTNGPTLSWSLRGSRGSSHYSSALEPPSRAPPWEPDHTKSTEHIGIDLPRGGLSAWFHGARPPRACRCVRCALTGRRPRSFAVSYAEQMHITTSRRWPAWALVQWPEFRTCSTRESGQRRD